MKAILQYDAHAVPPLLTVYTFGAPHKRQHRKVLQEWRETLYKAAVRGIGSVVDMPIDHPTDVSILFTNPNSPDLDHLIEAFFMAVDGKSLKGPSIFKDDRQIQAVNMKKYYPNESTKRDGIR